jgi:hypothetical protein
MVGHVGIKELIKCQGKGNPKGTWWGPGGVCQHRETACFSFSGYLKTFVNAWKGWNQVIPIQ